MSISIAKIRRELREAWAREYGTPCSQSARWDSVSKSDDVCAAACDLTGARFLSIDGIYPDVDEDCDGCAEALIAQWEGLAPVVKMPKVSR